MTEQERCVDVVMPCYDTAPDYLWQAVISVEAQRIHAKSLGWSMNLRIVDDASRQNATRLALKQIAANFSWVDVLVLGRNLGPAGSRNQAIERSKSRWIAFLDSDDYWIDHGFVELLRHINEDPRIDWISGDLFMEHVGQGRATTSFYPSQADRFKHLRKAYETGERIKLSMPVEPILEGSLCSMGSCIMSSNLLNRVGLFNSRLRKGVDTELYWRLARNADLHFIPTPIFVYRRHPGSVSGDGPFIGDWEPEILSAMLNDPQWSQYRPALRRRLIRTLINLSTAEAFRGNRFAAIRCAKEALVVKPYGKRPWGALLSALRGSQSLLSRQPQQTG